MAHDRRASNFNLKKLVQTPYFIMGTRPPPIGGVTIFVERFTHRLKRHFQVRNVDFQNDSMLKLLLFFVGHYLNPKYRIVHTHTAQLSLMPLIALRPYPFYFRIHDHSYRKVEQLSSFQRFIFNFILKRATELVLIGKHMPAYYQKHGIHLTCKVKIRSPFIPPDLSQEPAILSSYPDDLNSFISRSRPLVVMNAFKYVLYNGTDLYGLDMGIELIRALRHSYSDIGLIIAVADSSSTSSGQSTEALFIEQIRAHGLEDHIYFLTGQKQLWPLFKKAQLMVRPTATDGYGVSVAEALFFGSKAVASDVCQRPRGTILFKNRDLEDFIEKCRQALS